MYLLSSLLKEEGPDMQRALLKYSVLLLYSPLFLKMMASLRWTSMARAKEGDRCRTFWNTSIALRLIKDRMSSIMKDYGPTIAHSAYPNLLI